MWEPDSPGLDLLEERTQEQSRSAIDDRVTVPGRFHAGAFLTALMVLVAACSSGDASGSTPSSTTITVPAAPATVPIACDEPTSLFPVQTVLDGADGSCRAWLDISYGRTIRGSTGSAAVWSGRTGYGTVLVIGAVHTLGEGWLGPSNTSVAERVDDPGEQTGVPRLFLIGVNGLPDNLASPWFGFYNPAIPAERNNNLMQDLLPREDFYVAVTDRQKLDVSGLPPPVEPIIRDVVPLYDPAGVTTAQPTWTGVAGGDLVLLIGYPQESGKLSASVGRVLKDDEAEQAVARLGGLGDPEGDILYEPDVEIIIEGKAVAGMSGGPVVDREGRLVGVMVRATDIHAGDQYVRAVRLRWIVDRLSAAVESLDAAERQAIEGYLESG